MHKTHFLIGAVSQGEAELIPRDILTNLKWSNEFEVVQTSCTSDRSKPVEERTSIPVGRPVKAGFFFPPLASDKQGDSLLKIRNRHASK